MRRGPRKPVLDGLARRIKPLKLPPLSPLVGLHPRRWVHLYNISWTGTTRHQCQGMMGLRSLTGLGAHLVRRRITAQRDSPPTIQNIQGTFRRSMELCDRPKNNPSPQDDLDLVVLVLVLGRHSVLEILLRNVHQVGFHGVQRHSLEHATFHWRLAHAEGRP